MWKKGTAALFLAAMWLSLTGFASLGTEGEDTLNALMAQLTSEDVEEILTEDKWDGKVMAKVDESVSIRSDASTDAAVIGKLFKGDARKMWQRSQP